MKKIIALLMTVALVACLFGACGGNTGDATTAAPGESTTEAPAAAVKIVDIKLTDELYAFGVKKDDAQLLADVNAFIAEIKADGTFDAIVNKYFGDGTPEGVTSAALDESKDQLVVTTNAAFPPFEYVEGETYYGIDMEIAKALAAKLGKELVIKNIKFSSVLTEIDAGYADIAMAGLTIKEDRKQFVNFSDTYYTASQLLVVKADDTTFDACTTAADVEAILTGLDNTTTIGVQTETTGQFYVTGDEDMGFAGLAAVCKGYDSGALAVQDMLNGNIQYVIIDEAPAKTIVAAVNAAN